MRIAGGRPPGARTPGFVGSCGQLGIVRRLALQLRDLVASGADQLFVGVGVSGQTPAGEQSLGHVFAKLGINSRIELARVAREHDQGPPS